ncbi:MAG: sulfotransferase family 2 domain-containing protein [Sandaracinaceae bacterium]
MSLRAAWRPTKESLRRSPVDLLRTVARHAVDRSALDGLLRPERVPWPYRRYLALPDRKLVYAQIPKVASGNLKRWMLLEAGIPEDAWELDPLHGIHPFADRTLRVADRSVCFDPSYRKVAFVRSPYRRLVSGFVDKLVVPYTGPAERTDNTPGRPILSWLRVWRRRRPLDVTFNDFLGFVCGAPDVALDEHWLPQVRFLADVRFDLLPKIERFAEGLEAMQALVGAQTSFTVKKARRPYDDAFDGYAGDLPIGELTQRDAAPRWTTFYTEETARRVYRRYRDDFERLGYGPELG